MNRSYRLLTYLVLISAIFVTQPPVNAQCGPDNLDSAPCCTPIAAALPVFPAISQGSKYVCFRDCGTVVNQNLCVDIDPPQPVNSGGIVCGVYTIKYKIKLCGNGTVLWRGTLRAFYARNWQEIDASGQAHGVWRFLLNGNFSATPFLQSSPQWLSPNVGPACYSIYNNIYVTGYIDYSFDCSSNTWAAAWGFQHDCDTIHHPPGSARPAPAGGYHPTRSFVFVGPSAGFVVDPLLTLTAAGNVGDEAMRWNDWAAIPNICLTEERASGQVQLVNAGCPCSTIPGAPSQYDEFSVNIAGGCGSFAQSQPAPGVPLRQKRIGYWTNPAVFPEMEHLSFASGDLNYGNGCNLLVGIEFFEGVGTVGGRFAVGYNGVVLDRAFLDLGSANRNPTNLARHVGAPHVTQHFLNLNMP